MSPAEAAALQFFQDTAQASDLEHLVESYGACIAAHGFQRAVCIRIATPGQPVQPKLLFGWGATTGLSERYASERRYRVDPTVPLAPDFFVPADSVPPPGVKLASLADLQPG